EDGQTIDLPGVNRFYGNTTWTYAGEAPAARRIELIGATGAPVVVPTSDVARFDSDLNSLSAADVRGTATGTGNTPVGNHDGCGCTVGRSDGSGTVALLGVAGALAVAIARRRRRRPKR
ncbi:MAG: MYXO-CTERM sorting domain-containing protein, partial [Polyangia bacterium]